MNINYDYYRIFYYVASLGSFSKAARELGNSQPNITRAMNNLEAQLHLQLFIRSKKGIQLTQEGKQLYEHVKIAFYHFNKAEEEMKENSELSSGYIMIGVSEIALHEVLLPVLSKFHQKYPQIKIQITNQSTPHTIELLKNSQVHFALVTSPFNIKSPLSQIKIKDIKEYLIANTNELKLKNREVKLDELINYSWISLVENTATHAYHQQFFKDNGLKFNPQITVATTDQVLPMIKAGLGIGFVPKYMIDENDKEVFIVETDKILEKRSIYLITDTMHSLSIATKALIDEIKAIS